MLTLILQRVPIKRALVSHKQQLLLAVLRANRRLAMLSKQLVPLPILARVRPPEHKRHDDSQTAHGQTSREASSVLGGLASKIDVAAHDAAHVSDGNEERHADGTLGRGRQRVSDPGDEAGEGAVETACDGEQEAVGDTWVFWLGDSELCDEAGDGDGVACNDVGRAFAGEIRGPCEDDGEDGGEDVDGDREELGIGAGVAQTLDDGWYGCGESI